MGKVTGRKAEGKKKKRKERAEGKRVVSGSPCRHHWVVMLVKKEEERGGRWLATGRFAHQGTFGHISASYLEPEGGEKKGTCSYFTKKKKRRGGGMSGEDYRREALLVKDLFKM